MKISVVFICIAIFADVKAHSERCHQHRTNQLKCECRANEDLDVLWWAHDRGDTQSIDSLNVSSCGSVDISSFIVLGLETTITSITVKNIKNTLLFCPVLSSVHLKKIELSDIGSLPEFDGECTFDTFNRLDDLHIENTVINKFSQSFIGVEVERVWLKNVLISNLRGLDFNSSNGSHLDIRDSYLNVTDEFLTLKTFRHIRIENTVIAFPYGKGNVHIFGSTVILSNNTLLHAAVFVTASHSINVTNTCGDGKHSGMRLNSSKQIVSYGNELPYQILYNPKGTYTDKFCPNGMCNCLLNRPPPVYGICKFNNCVKNHAKTIHPNFFMYFIVIASAIVTRI